jgi:hypothetical protein
MPLGYEAALLSPPGASIYSAFNDCKVHFVGMLRMTFVLDATVTPFMYARIAKGVAPQQITLPVAIVVSNRGDRPLCGYFTNPMA